MNMFHWSSKPIRLQKRKYEQCIEWKPRGLWFDVDADWKRWCVAEDFGADRLTYCHEVTLSGNVLRLKSAAELDSFTHAYGAWPDYYPLSLRRGGRNIHIDWRRVASEYDGIIIAPYVWARRMDLMWYYGWDCASGCVWNVGVVKLNQLSVPPDYSKEEVDA